MIIEKHSQKLAEALKKLRMEAGISKNELSKAAEVSRHSITEIEEGNSQPTTGTLMRIAYALNVSCEEVFKFVEADTEVIRKLGDGEKSAAQNQVTNLDEDLEKSFFKLRRKSRSNPDLRLAIMQLAKLQTVYQKQSTKESTTPRTMES